MKTPRTPSARSDTPSGGFAMPVAVEHREVRTNGIRLHVVEAGPREGELVILLHGFGEPWFGWRQQIGALAQAGYRVVAPDQRGHNLSDRPPAITDYTLDVLARDVVGLVDALGRKKARVVGHDLGALVAWWTALRHPERVQQLAVLNGPHPQVWLEHFRYDFEQIAKSWYVFYFQQANVAEQLLRVGDWAFFKAGLMTGCRPGTFSAEDIVRYQATWERPGADTAMLNYYRALLQAPPEPPADPSIHVPTLVLWGRNDPWFSKGVLDDSVKLCKRGRLQYLEDAGHLVQHDQPEQVSGALLAFFDE